MDHHLFWPRTGYVPVGAGMSRFAFRLGLSVAIVLGSPLIIAALVVIAWED